MCLHRVSCAVLSQRRVLRSTFTLMKLSPAPARYVPLHHSRVSSVLITTKLIATWSTSMQALPQIGNAYSACITLMLIVSVSLPRREWYQIGLSHLLFQIYGSFFLVAGSRMSIYCIMAFLGKVIWTLEQSTCWLPVCLVTHNISSEAENSFISAILPRHCL